MAIQVLMTTDKNYISQARVAIWSARRYTDIETELIITILCAKELDQKSRERLLALENEWENLVIRFHEVDERDFAGAEGGKYISVAAYYRLAAAKILESDKCIYLDCDLIVSLDLNDLYRVDISDSYVGGVVDMGLILQPNLAFRYMNNCNIKDFSDYINTGVLLMNLDLMRKDQLIEKFLFDMVHEDNPWLDQDVINRICHGRIHLLDWTFNHIVGFTDEEYRWQCGESGRTGQGEIYHWAGLNKPWYNYAFRQAEIWWERAKEALEPWVYQELYDVADRCMRQAFFSRIAEQCRGRDEIVIAGFSDHGIRVMRYLRQCGVTGKIIFCDNDKLKEKMHLMGCLVLSVEKAADTYRDAVWINAIQNERDKINKQLGNLGIPLSQIVEYHAVNSEYYLGLSRKYMRKGMEERVYLQG